MRQLTGNDLSISDEKGVWFAYVKRMSLYGRRVYV